MDIAHGELPMITTTIETVQVRGRPGDWNAKVVDWAETLPCVHWAWWTKGARYHDPNPATANYWFADHVALMRAKKRVILAPHEVNQDNPRRGGSFKHSGYIAIFEIDDITLDERGLRFRFVRRLANAR
jgi:hypothetical protein